MKAMGHYTCDEASPSSDIKSEEGIDDSHASSSTKPTRAHKGPSYMEWELHKAEIRRLYLEESKPLREVIETMKKNGFDASPKMYKTRLHQWGFMKNNREQDIVQMLQVQQSRGAAGKQTTFYRHGKPVSIDSYLRRKRLSPELLAESRSGEQLPGHIRCRTPPKPDPRYIQSPNILLLQELLAQCIKNWTRKWHDPCDRSILSSFKSWRESKLGETTFKLWSANQLFRRGYYQEGGIMCSNAFDTLGMFAREPNIHVLVELLMITSSVSTALAEKITKYIAAYGEIVDPRGSLCQLFKNLNFLLQAGDESYATIVSGCLANILSSDLFVHEIPQETGAGMIFHIIAMFPDLWAGNKVLPAWNQAFIVPVWSQFAFQALARIVDRINPVSLEDSMCVDIMRLTMAGHRTSWKGDDVLSIATDMLSRFEGQTLGGESILYGMPSYIATESLFMFHRSRCGSDLSPENPRHELAMRYMERLLYPNFKIGERSEIAVRLDCLEVWCRDFGYSQQLERTQLERQLVHRRLRNI